MTLHNLTVIQLEKAISIKEEIERMEGQLAAILGDGGVPVKLGRPKGSRTMSAEARARIAAGQKARWAKFRAAKGSEPKADTAPRKRRKMSAAGRANIVAAAKARWAKVKAAGKNAL